MRLTPHAARRYLLMAAFCLAFPALGGMYKGATGKLLVASPSISGPPFEESVLYIVRHNLFGAYGYIINRPLDPEEKNKLFPDNPPDLAYYGGPVDYPRHRYVMGWQEGFIRFFTGTDPHGPLLPGNKIVSATEEVLNDPRMVIGYAGWFAMQLNVEIGWKHGWDTIEYDPALVFETKPDEIWAAARRQVLENQKVRDGNI